MENKVKVAILGLDNELLHNVCERINSSRPVDVHHFTELKDFLGYSMHNRPDIVGVSVNYPHKSAGQFPKIFRVALKVPVIGFGENQLFQTRKLLSTSGADFKITGVLTAHNLWMKILNYQKRVDEVEKKAEKAAGKGESFKVSGKDSVFLRSGNQADDGNPNSASNNSVLSSLFNALSKSNIKDEDLEELERTASLGQNKEGAADGSSPEYSDGTSSVGGANSFSSASKDNSNIAYSPSEGSNTDFSSNSPNSHQQSFGGIDNGLNSANDERNGASFQSQGGSQFRSGQKTSSTNSNTSGDDFEEGSILDSLKRKPGKGKGGPGNSDSVNQNNQSSFPNESRSTKSHSNTSYPLDSGNKSGDGAANSFGAKTKSNNLSPTENEYGSVAVSPSRSDYGKQKPQSAQNSNSLNKNQSNNLNSNTNLNKPSVGSSGNTSSLNSDKSSGSQNGPGQLNPKSLPIMTNGDSENRKKTDKKNSDKKNKEDSDSSIMEELARLRKKEREKKKKKDYGSVKLADAAALKKDENKKDIKKEKQKKEKQGSLLKQACQFAMESLFFSKEIEVVSNFSTTEVVVFLVSLDKFKGLLILSNSLKHHYEHHILEEFPKKVSEFLYKKGISGQISKAYKIKAQSSEFPSLVKTFADFSVSQEEETGRQQLVAFVDKEVSIPTFEESDKEGMYLIDIKVIPPQTPVNFDAFLFLPRNQRFVRYLKDGRSLSLEQAKRHTEETGQHKLYLPNNHKDRVIQFFLQNTISWEIAIQEKLKNKAS